MFGTRGRRVHDMSAVGITSRRCERATRTRERTARRAIMNGTKAISICKRIYPQASKRLTHVQSHEQSDSTRF